MSSEKTIEERNQDAAKESETKAECLIRVANDKTGNLSYTMCANKGGKRRHRRKSRSKSRKSRRKSRKTKRKRRKSRKTKKRRRRRR